MNKNNYRLLSRKYRPSNLNELKGQEILVKALSYAIANNKLAQSYLLTGIRGIGKTTTARIIAKTINCTNLKISNNIPIACEECHNCLGAASASHPDIIEIDAASRTGVEDVRVIIENAEYKPLLGEYKVFVIDEVHMLSKNAFNALLKLLEEPASHTLFIFATTEVHKIPLTIISRCQRFDLSRFSNENLEDLLKYVCELENINCSIDARKIIALKADGSARDGLSLLDQANILSCDSPDHLITKELINNMISAVDHDVIVGFLREVVKTNSDACLKILEEHHNTHTDFQFFISSLLTLLAYIAKKLAICDFKSEEFYSFEDEVKILASEIDMTFAQIAWQLCYKAQVELKNSTNQLEYVQMLALKLIYIISSKHNVAPTPLTETSLDKKKLNYDDFLRFLYKNTEMDLYYTLLNKVELSSANENSFIIKTEKTNSKFEQEVKNQLKKWSAGLFDIKFEYGENITPYKEKLREKISSHEVMQKLVKNFSDVKITDILMQ